MTLQHNYERQLLAHIISDFGVYYQNADIIVSDLFEAYSDLFDAYYTTISEGKKPTIAKLVSLIPDRKSDIADLMAEVDYGVTIHDLVGELEESRRVREINRAMTKAGMEGQSEQKIKTLTDAITGIYKTDGAQFVEGYEAAKDAIRYLEQERVIDIPTGFRYWDKLTGGMNRSDLVVLAAETSQGKTSLALNLAQASIDRGVPAAFISLEMTQRQLMVRMLCSHAEIPSDNAKENINKIMAAGSDFQGKGFHVADVTNNSVTYVLGLIRSSNIRNNTQIVFVDYLQLVSNREQRSREQEIGQIARAMKNIAKELNICVVLLSQLGRPKVGQSHYPTLNRLRDSGQIEEAADVVAFIYRAEEYGIYEDDGGDDTRGLAEIIIAKGRNYGTGKFIVRFNREITKFSDRHHPKGGYDAAPPPTVEDEMPF